jgi:hypothetical protein
MRSKALQISAADLTLLTRLQLRQVASASSTRRTANVLSPASVFPDHQLTSLALRARRTRLYHVEVVERRNGGGLGDGRVQKKQENQDYLGTAVVQLSAHARTHAAKQHAGKPDFHVTAREHDKNSR